MQTDYVVPQDNGVRMGTRWAELGLSSGRLRIEARSSFAFAVRPWSNRDLERALHADELAAGSLLWVHLDTGVNGLGSAACGPAVRAVDRLITASATLAVTFG